MTDQQKLNNGSRCNSEAELCLDSIEKLYKSLKKEAKVSDDANLLLNIRNWLTTVSDFDPATGHAMPVGLVEFLGKIQNCTENISNDRVYRIVKHVDDALHKIVVSMREKILREHVMMPIYAAREVDKY